MARSSCATLDSVPPSRRRWRATSARTIAGVRQVSARSISRRAVSPSRVPRRSSTQAKESIVSVVPVLLGESGAAAPGAGRHPVEGPGPPLAHESSDGLVHAGRVKQLPEAFELAEGLSRHAHRRLGRRHAGGCMQAYNKGPSEGLGDERCGPRRRTGTSGRIPHSLIPMGFGGVTCGAHTRRGRRSPAVPDGSECGGRVPAQDRSAQGSGMGHWPGAGCPRSSRMTWAALWPGAPLTPPPGWVPAPQR